MNEPRTNPDSLTCAGHVFRCDCKHCERLRKEGWRDEAERWQDKANESGAAYANANSKHHAEWERANRLEAMLDRLAGQSDDNLARAQAAEAELAELRDTLRLRTEAPVQGDNVNE